MYFITYIKEDFRQFAKENYPALNLLPLSIQSGVQLKLVSHNSTTTHEHPTNCVYSQPMMGCNLQKRSVPAEYTAWYQQ
jgi:hypothetical protein